MRKIINSTLTLALVSLLASCGNGSKSSSDCCFGSIPANIADYEMKCADLRADLNENNYSELSEKEEQLKTELAAKNEEAAKELSGKEIKASTEPSQLIADGPVTLVYDSMNHSRPVFKLGGKVTAASDLQLNIDPSELKGETLLSGAQVTVSVKMPVAIEFLGKDGKVIKTQSDIGTLDAVIEGDKATVKAGTPVDLSRTFTVGEDMEGVESVKLSCNLKAAPYTSRGLK